MSMTVIEHIEITAATQAAMTFSSIPQDYTDLYIVASLRDNRTGFPSNFFRIEINGSESNISARTLSGNGSSAASFTFTGAFFFEINSPTSTANTFSNTSFYIPNYASTTTYKSISGDNVYENNATAAGQQIGAILYSSNTAITSFTIKGSGNDLLQYSSATLYGITAGSSGGVTVS